MVKDSSNFLIYGIVIRYMCVLLGSRWSGKQLGVVILLAVMAVQSPEGSYVHGSLGRWMGKCRATDTMLPLMLHAFGFQRYAVAA